MRMAMIINGHSVNVSCNQSLRLQNAIQRTLKITQNESRPLNDWQVRDANGVLLETQRKLKDFKFENGTRLFLSLAVGAGGEA
jgi:hypothetical protein